MLDLAKFDTTSFIIYCSILLVALVVLLITRKLLHVSFPYFFMGLVGLIVGLIVGSLVSQPLQNLPQPYGRWIPLVVNVFLAVAVIDLFLAQSKPTADFFQKLMTRRSDGSKVFHQILVDTSVLIDGRIEEIAKSGFISGDLFIPDFILQELQTVADNEDHLKRLKGRHGLEILTGLRRIPNIHLKIIETNPRPKEKNDQRVINLARSKNFALLTVDYNLNQVAQIQGIDVLNINQLAEALKPTLLPGEELEVKVIQKGKSKNQGVGYLVDGTMIVVENGGGLVGKVVRCEVERIFHTLAGKMIFVQIKKQD
jgi:uncharacterized protein YacL